MDFSIFKGSFDRSVPKVGTRGGGTLLKILKCFICNRQQAKSKFTFQTHSEVLICLFYSIFMYFAWIKAFSCHVIIVLLIGFTLGVTRGSRFEIWQLLLFIDQLYVRTTLTFLRRVSAVTQSNVIVCCNYRERNSFCYLLK